jgi:hypothetical protein
MFADPEFELMLPSGPTANINFSAVLVGSIEPPFQDLQFEHMALTVMLPFEIPVPGWVVMVTLLV